MYTPARSQGTCLDQTPSPDLENNIGLRLPIIPSMFAALPDFSPRDSHSLWYASTRNPIYPSRSLDPAQTEPSASSHGANRPRNNLIERTTLARLDADEHYLQRRRANVQNFGSGWLKPPGVPKTLHQMREEKREQEEHQEALRREQLAQELAEAEAAEMQEDGTAEDMPLDGARDLDEDIPEAGDDFALSVDENDDDDDDDDDDEDDDEQASVEGIDNVAHDDAIRTERENELVAARMMMSGDAFREALIRGEPEGDDVYGEDENFEDDVQGHLLDEDDFAASGLDDGMGFDMDANLDDDIPEAESGGYEHTDSEAELSSSSSSDSDRDGEDDDDEADQDISFAPRAAPLGPPDSPTLRGRASTSGPRSSMDLSNLLSQDESSFMNSSPAQGRRTRHG
ncbi:hypothetical protein HJFPF1_00461 [Paramyrothecium foliicola]|nr:hypothetical protein HJFPF1_00461 [Paramyrothecium foliicola]